MALLIAAILIIALIALLLVLLTKAETTSRTGIDAILSFLDNMFNELGFG